ncbi:conjugal transfer protein MobC [Chitinophaga tropicalis]|uniref:Type IV secretion system DNA-binding domain-containing protein n=1 Tax=Chitinophaga tropicalis TaxID=2683588 RepID=A0A7K1U0A4_9BACT|nr:conjugal transfer protein MobC [Chitinophaga tropicalis]MVT07730.1 type IV secretion system DNA-binding domain-containing protein [Chitinophaga tropicalis]
MLAHDDESSLKKIIDLIRLGSIVLLLLHLYYYCHTAWAELGLSHPVVRKVLENLTRTGLFSSWYISKLWALGLLMLSVIGSKGKKNEKIRAGEIVGYLTCGLALYWISFLLFYLPSTAQVIAFSYGLITAAGYLFILAGGARLSRLLKLKLTKDVFNTMNETFPQEERLLENEYSFNLPARYNLKGKIRKSWINCVSPTRGILVAGNPGSGKSAFVIREIIVQAIRKGYTLCVYDFKYDDLTRIVYNTLLRYKGAYQKEPAFCLINFDDLSRTHRCNPLDPHTMTDITDASESARTIMLGINKAWIRKQGDFWVESPINFITGILWFLRKYKDGRYCTLPHVIELMQAPYDDLFPVLRTVPECEPFLNAFVMAYVNGALEQLEGQVASAKIGMARLSSPQLYYVLSGQDFTLDINNPESPKLLCIGNNPQKTQIYGAVLSLYVNRLLKLINQKGKLKSCLVFDEFPTIYVGGASGIDTHIATARSNRSATVLAVQHASQLIKDYGKEQAEVILTIVGNIISGQVPGDMAKQLSERFGKILQEKDSVSINRNDTSISKSTQLDYAIPPSTISALSSGEFVGMVADTPDQRIDLKTFHCEIITDFEAINREEATFKDIPVIRAVDPTEVQQNYQRIKDEVQQLLAEVKAQIERDPALAHLLILREPGA